jgi:hypothetical protein
MVINDLDNVRKKYDFACKMLIISGSLTEFVCWFTLFGFLRLIGNICIDHNPHSHHVELVAQNG